MASEIGKVLNDHEKMCWKVGLYTAHRIELVGSPASQS